jgi:hypothetical protein
VGLDKRGQGLFLDVLVEGRINSRLEELLVALAQETIGLDQVGIIFQGRFVFCDGLAILVIGKELVCLTEMVIRLELADLELFASGKGEDDDERECGYPKTVYLSF